MNYITYKDLTIPVVVNFRTLKKFQSQTGEQYNDIEKILNDLTLIEQLFWFAIESGCKSEKQVVPISREECEDVLSENFGEFIKIFMEDVVKTFTPKNLDPEFKAEEEVKKN